MDKKETNLIIVIINSGFVDLPRMLQKPLEQAEELSSMVEELEIKVKNYLETISPNKEIVLIVVPNKKR